MVGFVVVGAKARRGAFLDPTQSLPQHPKVATEKREEKRRYRLRRAMRKREAAQLAAEQHQAGNVGGGDAEFA
jgi:hypothetical protein